MFSVLALLLLPQTPASPDLGVRQPEVVVTAARVPQTVDDALASVTVIDREEIERNQSLDEVGQYASAVVLALIAVVTLILMTRLKPKEGTG